MLTQPDDTTAQLEARRRLLVIDDEQKICGLLVQYFSLKGYEVRSVSNGEEALALADIFQPNVVLLDLLIPGMSGVDLLKRLKQLCPPPKVIMLSAADLPDVAQGALQLGADSYVCKPPDLPQLERLVHGIWPSTRR